MPLGGRWGRYVCRGRGGSGRGAVSGWRLVPVIFRRMRLLSALWFSREQQSTRGPGRRMQTAAGVGAVHPIMAPRPAVSSSQAARTGSQHGQLTSDAESCVLGRVDALINQCKR